MTSAFLPGLRNLRVSLLVGGMLLGSIYILFGHSASTEIEFRDSAKQIVEINKFMPAVLIGLSCILVGSLFMTGLEGIVDGLNRKYVSVDLESIESKPMRRLILAFTPFSASADQRIRVEADRFYSEYAPLLTESSSYEPPSQQDFREQVKKEILWLDGKLAGTPLEVPYDQFRSEGELRLGTAIVLPLAAAAAAYAMNFSVLGIIVTIIAAILLSIRLGDYGLYYFRRAHSFMAHHIADGKLLSPSMETLKRAAEVQSRTEPEV